MKIPKRVRKLLHLITYLKWPFALYVVASFAFTAVVFLAETPTTIRSDAINIVSAIFVTIGTLYLAYDLLSGINGPLRWVTLVMTYAVVGVIGVEHFPVSFAIGDLVAQRHDPGSSSAIVALLIVIVGALIGIFGGILIALRRFADNERWQKILSVFVSGITGAVITFLFLLATHRTAPLNPTKMWIAMAGGFVCAGLVQIVQLIVCRASSSRSLSLQQAPKRLFSWLDGAIGLVSAVLFATVFVFTTSGTSNKDFWLFLLFFCASPIAAAGFSHSLFWKVSSLSKNALAVFGLVVILAGSLLQFWVPVTEIVKNTNLPTIGKTARDGSLQFTVTNVEDPCLLYPTLPRGKFYCVTVTVHNVSDQGREFQDSDQELLNVAGRQFWADANPSLYVNRSDSTSARTIDAGAHIDLKLAFDIPTDQKPTTVQLHDSSSNTSEGVKVQLSSGEE